MRRMKWRAAAVGLAQSVTVQKRGSEAGLDRRVMSLPGVLHAAFLELHRWHPQPSFSRVTLPFASSTLRPHPLQPTGVASQQYPLPLPAAQSPSRSQPRRRRERQPQHVRRPNARQRPAGDGVDHEHVMHTLADDERQRVDQRRVRRARDELRREAGGGGVGRRGGASRIHRPGRCRH